MPKTAPAHLSSLQSTLIYRCFDHHVRLKEVTMSIDNIPWIPECAIAIIQDEDENVIQTACAKGILREPQSLAGYTFRIEYHSSTLTIGGGIPNIGILADLSHENIIKVYGMGKNFIVTDFWDETLQSRLQRLTKEPRRFGVIRNFYKGKREQRDSKSHFESLDLWQHIALPVTQALLYLHQQHVSLGGALDLTSIVLSGESLVRPPWVFLRDFSKAVRASIVAEFFSDVYALLSDDVFQLGLVLTELSRIQPLQTPNAIKDMDTMIGACCHLNPFMRPSVRRVYKRFLKILSYETTTSSFPSCWKMRSRMCPAAASLVSNKDGYLRLSACWSNQDCLEPIDTHLCTSDNGTSLKEQHKAVWKSTNNSITTASTSNASFYKCECSVCGGTSTPKKIPKPVGMISVDMLDQLDELVKGLSIPQAQG